MLKIILFMFFSIVCFGATRYVTPNMVVQNSELYCLNSNKILVYSVGDIVDGDFAQGCSYNRDSVEDRLQRINEYSNSFAGKFHNFIKNIFFIFLMCALIFFILCLFFTIKSIIRD
jgi:hypothetical protein